MNRESGVRAWLPCILTALAWGCGSSTPGAAAPADAPSGTAQAGSVAIALPRAAGGPRENGILRLEVTEAGFFPTAGTAPVGQRYYTVGIRGTSRSDSAALMGASKGDDVVIDARRFVFAQNERGCLSQPEFAVAGVPNLFGDSITFSPAKAVEGRLVFLVPDDTQRIRVLITPAGPDGLAVPAGDDFTPAWPPPIHTIDDGATLRLLVLPSPAPSAALSPPAAGREHVVLDVVVQNLRTDQGVEFQPSQQLRLMDPAGRFVQASPATSKLGCRMDDGGAIPPGQARRLQAVYEMPAGAARRLHYRGFEREETVVSIR